MGTKSQAKMGLDEREATSSSIQLVLTFLNLYCIYKLIIGLNVVKNNSHKLCFSATSLSLNNKRKKNGLRSSATKSRILSIIKLN